MRLNFRDFLADALWHFMGKEMITFSLHLSSELNELVRLLRPRTPALEGCLGQDGTERSTS